MEPYLINQAQRSHVRAENTSVRTYDTLRQRRENLPTSPSEMNSHVAIDTYSKPFGQLTVDD